MRQIYQTPLFRRAYWRGLKELCKGPMLAGNVNPIVDTKYSAFQASGINVASPSGIKSYIASARTSILSQLAAEDTTDFTVDGPASFDTANNLVALTGNAPMEIKTIRVNGVAYPAAWNTVTGWSINVPVNAGQTTLSIQCYDIHGNLLPNYSAAIIVNYTGAAELPQNSLVINEIMYAPAIPGAEFVELYNNSPDFTFDLSNWRFHGLDYTFPEGSLIAPNSFLVLARDLAAFNLAYGGGIPVFGLFDGKLDSNRETLTLIQPGATSDQDIPVSKVRYEAQPPWPLPGPNSGGSLQLIDPSQDVRRVANWAAGSPTPGSANGVQTALPPFPTFWINEVQPENLNGIRDSAGETDPWIEIYNTGVAPVFL